MKFTNCKAFILATIVLSSLILSIKLNNYNQLTTDIKVNNSNSDKENKDSLSVSNTINLVTNESRNLPEIQQSISKRLEESQAVTPATTPATAAVSPATTSASTATTSASPAGKQTCKSDEVWNISQRACQKILSEYHPNNNQS